MKRINHMLRMATILAVCLAVAIPTTGLAQRNGDQGRHQGQARGNQDGGKRHDKAKNNRDKAKQDKHNQDRNQSKDVKRSQNRGKDPKKQGLHDNRNQYWKSQQAQQLRDRQLRDRQLRDRQLRAQQLRRSQQAAQYRRQYGTNNNGNLSALSRQRQKTKNEWRNIAMLSGAVAVLGILMKDNRLVFAGAAGALYSLYRYEQDRKSQSKVDRLRASYFSRSYFVRDGRRYDRRTVTRNGQRYYQFVRR